MSQQRNEGQPPERFDKIQYADLSPERCVRLPRVVTGS